MTTTESTGRTRRRVLRTAVNLGVGAGLVWGAGAPLGSPGDTVEIEYALTRSPRRETLTSRTKPVPADWYASVEAAFDVQQTLRDLGLSSLVGAFVVPGSFDEPAGSIAVDATSEDVGETVGEIAGDVEIDLTVVDEFPEKPDGIEDPGAPYEVSDLDRNRVPGGVVCTSPEMSGTLAPATYDVRRNRRFFVTSNHVYGGGGTKTVEHRGEPLSLESGGETRTIGRVDRGHPEADVALVTPVDGYLPTPRIERADPSRVVGQFTKIGLAELAARGEPLQKVGAFSGHTTGGIRGVDGFTCYFGTACKRGQLKWGDEHVMTDGDSGSITYAPDPEYPEEFVIAGGINNARSWWPGADFTWGTGAHQLLETYGIHF